MLCHCIKKKEKKRISDWPPNFLAWKGNTTIFLGLTYSHTWSSSRIWDLCATGGIFTNDTPLFIGLGFPAKVRFLLVVRLTSAKVGTFDAIIVSVMDNAEAKKYCEDHILCWPVVMLHYQAKTWMSCEPVVIKKEGFLPEIINIGWYVKITYQWNLLSNKFKLYLQKDCKIMEYLQG